MVDLRLEGAALREQRSVPLLGGARRGAAGRGGRGRRGLRGRGGVAQRGARRDVGRDGGSLRRPLLVAASASKRLVVRREARLLAGQRLLPALQARRRRQRALAFEREPAEARTALAEQLAGGAEPPGDLGVGRLGRLERLGQAPLLLRPAVLFALLGAPGQLAEQALALLGRGALHFLQQAPTLLGETAAALEAPVEHAGAQQALGAPLALRQAPRERLFLAGARLGHLLEALLAARALVLQRRRARPWRAASSASSDADVAAQQPATRLREVGLDAAQLLGGAGLAAQRRELRADLALQQIGALEVAAHLAQLELGALAAALVGAQPGGLLDLAAPVLRLAGQERLDLALADDRVQLLAEPHLRHELDDVGEPARRTG